MSGSVYRTKTTKITISTRWNADSSGLLIVPPEPHPTDKIHTDCIPPRPRAHHFPRQGRIRKKLIRVRAERGETVIQSYQMRIDSAEIGESQRLSFWVCTEPVPKEQ